MADPARLHTGARFVPAPAEDLCLDFADTRYWRGSEQPTEALQSFADVVAWCEAVKSLDHAAAVELMRRERSHAAEAASIFAEVIAAREMIYRVFSTTASGGPIARAELEMLNRLLAAAPSRANVAVVGAGKMWRVAPVRPSVASLLASVLWSAADLLVGARLSKVRLCANEKCGWLFLDDSKSGTRRWCSMTSCGNRAKAHRHYMRKTRPDREAVLQRRRTRT